MCGIAGIVHAKNQSLDAAMLTQVGQVLQHRGPDDTGFLLWPHAAPVYHTRQLRAMPGSWVGLVHRRLAILDLGATGWQPMATCDGRYHIVFNGEIYNYLELRADLETCGHTFHSRSDTEVLLAAYVQWGAQAPVRLVGMFAFVVLDVQKRTLFLARDCFGMKPLYYASWRDGFAFASEIKALLALPEISRQVDASRLYQYLRFGLTDHGGATLFADIGQVPAAHFLEIALDCPQPPQPVRYWQIDLTQRRVCSFSEAAAHLRELFLQAVSLHLRSDVAVGAALSGGIDSAAIVMAMRSLQGAHGELPTFSYIADDPGLSEEHWIDLVGQVGATLSHKVRPTPSDLLADIETLVALQDEPFSSTSLYAQRRVFQLAHATGIKVILDGQGADELLGGYRPYLAARLASLLRQGRLGAASAFLSRVVRLPGTRGLQVLGRALGLLLPAALQGPGRKVLGADLMPAWLNRAWFAGHGVSGAPLWQAHGPEVLREHLHQSLVAHSLPMLLRYEDRNSMAFSLESRTPFLTPALAEFVLSLPEEYLIAPDGTSKAVFRHAMRGIVPDAILDRRDKIGFATPEHAWLRVLQPWGERLLSSEVAESLPALRLAVVRRLWQEVMVGRRPFDTVLWRWLNVICWAQRFQVRFD